LDKNGDIYTIGDNSEDQCAVAGTRANAPEKIMKEFAVSDVHAGDSHNLASDKEGTLFSWGGTSINSSWIKK